MADVGWVNNVGRVCKCLLGKALRDTDMDESGLQAVWVRRFGKGLTEALV